MNTIIFNRIDGLGIGGSLLCAIHCAICAFIPGILGILGFDFLLDSKVEWFFTIVACIVAVFACFNGFSRHRSVGIVLLFILGISTLLATRILEETLNHAHTLSHHGHHHDSHEVWAALGIIGAAFIVTGHLLSMKSHLCCKDEDHSNCKVNKLVGDWRKPS